MDMQKGFITIATGSEHYLYLANNLLKSYKLWTNEPLPFAIITNGDIKNSDWLADFDVIIDMPEARGSFMDKIEMLKYLPFEETIFIDADTLVYDDLNSMWNAFEHASDFSSLGVNHPLDAENGFFTYDNVKNFYPDITAVPNPHGGGITLKKVIL